MMMTGEVKNPQGLATASKRYIKIPSVHGHMTNLIPCAIKTKPFVKTVYTHAHLLRTTFRIGTLTCITHSNQQLQMSFNLRVPYN